MCLLLKEKSRHVHKRSMINVCTKNLVLQIDRGNLWNCPKTSRQACSRWNRRTCEIKRKHTHSERTICSWRKSWHCVIQHGQRVQPCNRRGEHWLQHSRRPNSTVKRSHGVNVHNLIQKIENHLSDKHFKVIFNNIDHSTLSAKNHKTWLKQLETLNYAKYSMLSRKHSAKHVCRTGTSASSTAHAVTSYEMIRQRTRSTSSPFLISSLSRTSTSGRADHTVTSTERKKVIKKTTLQISSQRSVRNDNS